MTPLESLVACGTKLWLDSIDPDVVQREPRLRGHRGDVQPDHHRRPDQDRPVRRRELAGLVREGLDDEALAWQLTDKLVARGPGGRSCRSGTRTKGNDGYVSFELDPLLEDPANTLSRRRARRSSTSSWARSGRPGTRTA